MWTGTGATRTGFVSREGGCTRFAGEGTAADYWRCVLRGGEAAGMRDRLTGTTVSLFLMTGDAPREVGTATRYDDGASTTNVADDVHVPDGSTMEWMFFEDTGELACAMLRLPEGADHAG